MGLWLNPRTGELKLAANPSVAADFKAMGWEKAADSSDLAHQSYHSFYSPIRRRWLTIAVTKGSCADIALKRLRGVRLTYEEAAHLVSMTQALRHIYRTCGRRIEAAAEVFNSRRVPEEVVSKAALRLRSRAQRDRERHIDLIRMLITLSREAVIPRSQDLVVGLLTALNVAEDPDTIRGLIIELAELNLWLAASPSLQAAVPELRKIVEEFLATIDPALILEHRRRRGLRSQSQSQGGD